jgi:hypothetical protein
VFISELFSFFFGIPWIKVLVEGLTVNVFCSYCSLVYLLLSFFLNIEIQVDLL